MSTQSTIADWGARQASESADESPLHERVLENIDGAAYRGRNGRAPTEEDEGSDNVVETTCEECGGRVSKRYARVQGLRGRVHACPNCTTEESLLKGAAAGQYPGGDLLE